MLIVCPSCATSYVIEPASVGPAGRAVRCARCKTVWFAGGPKSASAVTAFVDGVIAEAEAQAAGLIDAVAPEGDPFAAFVERFAGPWMKQRPQVMRAFKWQSAARKLGLARAHADLRDRDLFAYAWCHAEHWQAAKDILGKETKK